jgi:pimeloyl-ACP methyl ester carboxylesterase
MSTRIPVRAAALLVTALALASGCAHPLTLRTAPAAAPKAAASHTVVFVHGMFVTPQCWADWERLFQERGYKTLAPPWPEHAAPIAEQRQAHPSARLGALTLDQVLAEYRKVLAGLPEKPILVGHSMGGLIVQLLLEEGLGVAGVAIDSAPPKGLISLKLSFLKSNWPVIRPGGRMDVPVALTFEQFAYAFVNGLPPAEQRSAFDTHAVPESRQVGKGPTTQVAQIDYKKPRPPLLLIAGSDDHIIPASLNRDNFHRYDKTPALTEFREFPGRNHWTIAESGWQDVAAFALEWLKANVPQ